MSHEADKIKHSKRIQKNNNAIRKQVKIARGGGLKNIVPHKFVKRHAMDCGRPRCALCSNPRRKGWGEPRTSQELRLFEGTQKRYRNLPLDEE
jgi:hypothetical protein